MASFIFRLKDKNVLSLFVGVITVLIALGLLGAAPASASSSPADELRRIVQSSKYNLPNIKYENVNQDACPNRADACVQTSGASPKIRVAPGFMKRSAASRQWVAMHELAHIYQANRMEELEDSGWQDRYKSGSYPVAEVHANCMAASQPPYHNAMGCSSSLINAASKTWEGKVHYFARANHSIKKGDVIAIEKSTGKLWNYGNLPSKERKARKQIGSGWQDFTQIAATDYNGDGIMDVAGIRKSGEVMVYEGLNGGGFKDKTILRKSPGTKLYAAKDTKASKSDSLFFIEPNGKLSKHKRLTGADYTENKNIGTNWHNFDEVTFGFFDGDANIDTLAKTKDGKLLLYRTNGSSYISENRKQVGHGWTGLDATTWFSNGGVSGGIIARDTKDNKLYYYGFNGKGGFSQRTQIGHGWDNFLIG